nr:MULTISPECIES: Fe(3+) ABC transporter substrate-binding protein [unclassified Roseofilum]
MTMRLNRRHFILAAGTGIAAVASKNIISRGPAIAQRTSLNLYSSRHYDTDDELYESFSRATGVKVNLIEGKAEQLIERVKSEGANTRADVLLTVDGGNLWRAKQDGILQSVNSSTLNQKIPNNLRDPQGYWFAFSKRARVIMYNKNKVSKSQLSTYEDLADSKWKGKILIRSSSNIYNQSLVGSLLAAHGEDQILAWSRGMVSNFARSPEGNDTAQIKACAAGVGDIAIANSYYLARLGKSSAREDQQVFNTVGIFFPNQTGPNGRGTHVNISGGGVVKHAKNQQAAIEFLEHLAERQAQQFFAEGNNEYPVVAGVPLDSVLQGFGSFKADPLNPDVFGKNNAEALKLMDRAGWK